jgi:hypothetical protein
VTTYYADSSALVKRYVAETGSGWIEGLCDPSAGHIIVVASIGLVEISSAGSQDPPRRFATLRSRWSAA